jgi:CheY-like chemotaxis protein
VTAGARRPRVLVVDDAPMNRHLLCLQLGQAGCEAVAADGAAAALAALEQARFDLAFVDLLMPDMDGDVLAAHLRRLESEHGWVPCFIVGLSAGDGAGDRCRALQAGMDEFCRKPLSAAQVAALVRAWLPWPV